MSDPAAIEPLIQKDAADCGISALAMLLGKPYVEVFQVAEAVSPKCAKRGLWNTELRRIAKRLGVTLKVVKPVPELTEATGILDVQKPKQGHYALIFQGVLINPADGLIWDVDAFLARGKWTARALIVKSE